MLLNHYRISCEFDRRRAKGVGENAFLIKHALISNPEKFLQEMMSVMSKDITLCYWGTRGTLPVPGKNSLRYCGNTLGVMGDIGYPVYARYTL